MHPPPLDPTSALFLDVDGTLLEIAPRPELVRVPVELPGLLDRLSGQRGGALALVSGRPLDQLDRLFHPWHGPAAGLHGAERRRTDGSIAAEPVDPAAIAALARLRPRLAGFAAADPRLQLEDKGGTVTLHYRAVPQREAEIRQFAEHLLRDSGAGLRLIDGKMVVEFQSRQHGKDRAVAAFLAEPPFCGRSPVFLGDDTTDEDGFREVNQRGGLSIRVGPPAATAADYTLPSVDAARAWLVDGVSAAPE